MMEKKCAEKILDGGGGREREARRGRWGFIRDRWGRGWPVGHSASNEAVIG